MDLMQATSTRGAVAMAYTSDDEDDRPRSGPSNRESRESSHIGRIRSNKQSS